MTFKRGSVADIFVFLVLTFVIGVVCVVFFMISNITEDKFLESAPSIQRSLSAGNNFTEVMTATYGAYPRSLESLKWITVMLIIGLAIGTMVSGYMVFNVSRAFFLLHVLIVIAGIIVSVIISNAYETIIQFPELSPYFSEFTVLNIIFSKLPIWTAIIGIVSIVIMLIGILKAEPGGYY